MLRLQHTRESYGLVVKSVKFHQIKGFKMTIFKGCANTPKLMNVTDCV